MPKPIAIPFLGDSERLVNALGLNAVKVGLVAALAAHNDRATSSQLAETLGIRQQLVSHHVRDLEADGLVTADRTDPRRGGAPITWVLNRNQLHTQWDDLTHRFFPRDS